jgi:uncharacterized protein with von Willebrand factor type A (vWA) domain
VAATDLASLAVLLTDQLREAGLPMSAERSGRLIRALRLVNPVSVNELYWVCRVTLVTRHADIDLFDRLFNQVFRGIADPADNRGDPTGPPPAHVRPRPATSPPTRPKKTNPQQSEHTDPAGSASAAALANEDDDRSNPTVIGMASRQERLAATDFGDLDQLELLELQRLMRQLRISPPARLGRRRRRHRRGDKLDLRATLRRSLHSGGDPVEQIYERRRTRPRRVVVLCDISGSMSPYARAYLQFLHATVNASPAEVFTFATRLTRLTKALSVGDPSIALARASAEAKDWRGGTRIGESIKAFLDDYGRRGMARRAIVVIVSDGWERDDPEVLAEQMARLRRLAHRVIWVNPRTADARYQPLVGGMAAVLPHCDVIVSGHSFNALTDVIAAISATATTSERPPRDANTQTRQPARRPA